MHLVSGSPFQTKKMIKMAEIAAGGKAQAPSAHRLQPHHDQPAPHPHALANAMIVAEAGLPNHILVMVQQGATSPISYAGSVANAQRGLPRLQHPVQCVNEPTLYGASACVMDMKRAFSSWRPRSIRARAAMARMSKYYNIPSYIAGG